MQGWGMLLTGAFLGGWFGMGGAPPGGLIPLMRGQTIAIDPGHGGIDSGSRGQRYHEDMLNLAIARDLRHWYEQAGARVIMTWSKPGEIGPHQRLNVRARTKMINASGATLLIDIHCNAGGAFTGPQTFYWDGAPSYLLAERIQEELQHLTHTRRAVSRIDQYVLRYANMPAVNVEAGFITNPREEALLAQPTYQRKLSWAIFVGTERWLVERRTPVEMASLPEHREMLVR